MFIYLRTSQVVIRFNVATDLSVAFSLGVKYRIQQDLQCSVLDSSAF